jgi:hypothetical protein
VRLDRVEDLGGTLAGLLDVVAEGRRRSFP